MPVKVLNKIESVYGFIALLWRIKGFKLICKNLCSIKQLFLGLLFELHALFFRVSNKTASFKSNNVFSPLE